MATGWDFSLMCGGIRTNPVGGHAPPTRFNPMTRNETGNSMKLLVMIAALVALCGCNTVNGVGQDISGGAATVQDWF